MALVTGAVGSIGPKLLELLKDEYKLQKGLRRQVKFVSDELESVHVALRKVAKVPWDQLDEQVKIWARQVREASYDMEDVLDTFLVRVDGSGSPKKGKLKRALKKMVGLFSKGKARHDIAGTIEDIKKQLQEVAERHARYKVDEIVSKPTATSTIDRRLKDMHNEVKQLIGIDKSSSELESMLLSQDGNDSNGNTKIVSVVGVGGLGKTTLAKAVYDKLKPHFDSVAFVPVGRNPDPKKVFRDILIDLDKERYLDVKYTILDEWQLIKELRDFLQSKRYFIVIDDVWDITLWKTIKSVLDQKHSGSRAIVTTRNRGVASEEEVYELDPLSSDDSKRLLYIRLFGSEGKCPDNHPHEASEKILVKCGGVPLAIITMASLLVGKSRQDWFDVCNSSGFYRGKGNQQVDDTKWILSLSYYDLPSHLRTCLLYLSVYPEDYEIDKDSLIWKWIAEGFVEKKEGTSLFQEGEEYFNQLVNRSMIQAVESERDGRVYGCRIHDMVLDLINRLSDQEKFVTISNDGEGTSTQRNVRRLALQKRMMKQAQLDDDMGMAQVRSLVACSCHIDGWVLHPSFKLLRVLDLEGCSVAFEGWQGLKHLGNLLHLRYLGLHDTSGIEELPEEIGKLKFLQSLDLGGSSFMVLPLGVCQLTQLVCLRGGFHTSAPDGLLTKLTSLEELRICIDDLNVDSQRQFMKDVGKLREVRVLVFYSYFRRMLQPVSLGNLHKLQLLSLSNCSSFKGAAATREWDRVVLPRHLQHLRLSGIWFRRVPPWISPPHLANLSHLLLCVDDMEEAGLRALGRLPQLCFLELELHGVVMACTTATVASITAGNGFFQKLRFCYLDNCMVQLVVNTDSTSVSFSIWGGKGAMAFVGSKTEGECSRSVAPPPVMPNLQVLHFEVYVRALYKDANGCCGNLGLECLPSLQKLKVALDCDGASDDDVEKAEADLRNAARLHPNGPIIIYTYQSNTHKRLRQSTDEKDEEPEQQQGDASLAGDEVAVTASRGDDNATPSC